MEKPGLSYITDGSIKWLNYFEEWFGSFFHDNIYPQDDSTTLFIVTQEDRNTCPYLKKKKVVHKCIC